MSSPSLERSVVGPALPPGVARLTVAALALLAACGSDSPPNAGGRATASPSSPTEDPGASAAERLEALRHLGYVDFSPEAVDEGEASGVVLWDRERAWPGFNLYCSRTRPEAYLMDLSGAIVHRWTHAERRPGTWSHVLLQPDGSLVVLVKLRHVMKLDRDSELLWKREHRAHHELAPDHALGDGFLTLLREVHEHRGYPVAFPSIAWLDAEGRERRRWSSYHHLDELRSALDARDFLDTVLDELVAAGEPFPEEVTGGRPYHYFHGNTVSRLPENALGDARFRAGNLLVCFRNVNQVFVLDHEDLRVTWSFGAGELDRPHHPTWVPGDRVLIYDNGHGRGHTRILEVDPLTNGTTWSYRGSPPESFFSRTKGSAQRLENGNTLVLESDAGRAREVTPAGEVVWAWNNPEMEDGHRGAVYRMTRVSPEAAGALTGTR